MLPYSLELLTYFERGLDLSMQVKQGLQIKGKQSYCPSDFEDQSDPLRLESGPHALAHTLAVMAKAADFFLSSPTLIASNFEAL